MLRSCGCERKKSCRAMRAQIQFPSCSARRSVRVCAAAKEVTLLDYGAGNVRSVRNAIKKLGYTIKDVSHCALDSQRHSGT